ncbi:outer membrane protein transport protein [Echinicola marina]|uniref:OmpP1/FadL family transporter n=1 Tax=Echinicola marina TaxID=2859768 RepID=UPI001CF642AC|nr:outer membrane protein transport protein [Echinicola marina]UCS93582.1 outer membrane protein transport protein [Echinicola marina]
MRFSTKKILGTVLLGILSINLSKAQTFDDALRYSYYNATGSARIMGIGGSQFALGGDVSNISGNPAGLGFFRKSEFSFTPSYENWQSNSSINGQSQSENTGNFSLPNLSMVFSTAKDPLNRDSWRGHSFGISINRISNFNNTFSYSHNQSPSSLLDYYAASYIDGEPPVGDPSGLPLDVELVYFDNATQNFYPSDYTYNYNADGTPNYNDPIAPNQSELVEKEGSLSQVTFAYGSNYKNKLFIGGSIGITSFSFSSYKTFNEEFIDNQNIKALDYTMRENLGQSGTGINLNAGLIYKPIDQINIGLSYSSPTWYRYDDNFDADITAEFFGLDGASEGEVYAQSNIYSSPINLRTPSKLSAGAAFFINKNGFITADIDYLNYGSMHLSSPDYSLTGTNDEISISAGDALNYRIGAEYRVNLFRFRAGTALYGDPYKNTDFDRTKTQYTGGIGVKLAKMYIDFAFVHSQFDTFYLPYPGTDIISTDNKSNKGMLTFGFNF